MVNKNYPIEYSKIIDSIECFIGTPESWCINQHIEECKNLPDCLNEINEKNEEKQVLYFTEIACLIYANKAEIDIHGDKYIALINDITERIKDFYFDRLRQQQDYYKNLFHEKDCSEYEMILHFIQDDLKKYDVNLTYCKKIIDFITNKFNGNCIFVTHTIFLKSYLCNALDSMILTICKMVLDKPDVAKKENCGIKYLQSYVNRSLTEEKRAIVKQELRTVGDKIKEVQNKTQMLENLRNSVIAHFDIGKREDVQKIKVSIEELENVFELLCKTFEILSMKYFLYFDIFSKKMIDVNGFKAYVCQNPIIHNHNEKMDIDIFFDELLRINLFMQTN